MARSFGPEVLVGAGTVLDPADVDRVREAGGRLVVMPHGDAAVIARAVDARPCLHARRRDADRRLRGAEMRRAGLKMFPAENLPPVVVRPGGRSSRKTRCCCRSAASIPTTWRLIRGRRRRLRPRLGAVLGRRDAGDGARQRPPLRGRLGADQGA